MRNCIFVVIIFFDEISTLKAKNLILDYKYRINDFKCNIKR